MARAACRRRWPFSRHTPDAAAIAIGRGAEALAG
jgi:hypothetical protein